MDEPSVDDKQFEYRNNKIPTCRDSPLQTNHSQGKRITVCVS
jgi:hypothetical protein